jgi:peroxiredoxin (alkyl hydroperoxide reductase subunit C)
MSEMEAMNHDFFVEPVSLVQKEAPNFTAKAVYADDKIAEMDLHKHIRGKYAVVFFYPLDFTFVCPSEIIAFHNRIDEFKKRNAEVIGISVDSEFSHHAWRKTKYEDGGIEKISYPLVADITKNISRSYGVLINEAVALRGTFIIDKKGIVRVSLVNDLPIGRSVDEILRLIDAVQFNEEHGEVCPANWSKGKDAMKPDQGGVAKYLKDNSGKL